MKATWKVPFLDLRAQYATLKPELDAAVLRVLASGEYILGPDVGALEREVAASVGLREAVAVSSGSDALLAALWAAGVGPGDEVITTAFSFFATAGAIARLGATPVFADIDHSFNLDPQSALARVTARTKAIVPVHLFGRVADLAPYTGLRVVADAAQAIGAPLHGTVTLSFFPSKNLGAAGDAGMVLTDDAALADRVRVYATHGARERHLHEVVGANLRMDTLQAAILRVKLRHLPAWQARRRANALRYRELLADTSLELPDDTPDHAWHQFVVRTARRDELRAFLRDRGVETAIYYPRALHQQPCFASDVSLPEAERAAREVLALPVHPDLTAAQIDHVARSIRDFT